ncbi:MAG: rod shape-determining protein MreD [Spirochaetaceae bacterium]
MNTRTVLYSVILVVIAVLQTNVLDAAAIGGVKPDLALIVIACFSVTNGSFEGQIGAFVGGLVEDLLSLAPPGFHMLVRALTGYLYGLLQDRMLVDAVLVPVILVAVGTLIKALVAAAVAAAFGVSGVATIVLSSRLWVELIYNAVLAPIVFGLLRLVKPLTRSRRETTV